MVPVLQFDADVGSFFFLIFLLVIYCIFLVTRNLHDFYRWNSSKQSQLPSIVQQHAQYTVPYAFIFNL
jgi:hypothetical protein